MNQDPLHHKTALLGILQNSVPNLLAAKVSYEQDVTTLGQPEGSASECLSFATSDGKPGQIAFWSKTPFSRDLAPLFQNLRDLCTAFFERQVCENVIRQEHQEALRSMTHQLSQVEEEERRSLAADLHDHIGQNLAVLRMKLSQLQGDAVFQGFDADFSSLRSVLEETIRATRMLSYELSSPTLYEFGLQAALESFAIQAKSKFGMEIQIRSQDSHCPLSKEGRILLFKTIRELLTNVRKHAQTQLATVAISREQECYVVRVMDQGCGFVPQFPLSLSLSDQGDSSAFGLFSIQERLKHVGGSIEIKSIPDAGTTVTLRYPLS